MAKAKPKGQVVDTWKRKRWYRVLAPKIFNEQVVGETPSLDPAIVAGRTISSNLMHLTRDMKKQNMNVVFEIDRVMGETAYTSVKSFEINPSSIKRFVRRGKERIDCSFICTTADSKKARIKPLLITSGHVKGSAATALRKKTMEFLKNRIKNTKRDILVQEVMHNRLQKSLKDALKKIYPIKICEIRILSFEGGGVKPAEKEEIPAEEGKAQEKKEEPEESKETKKEEPKAEAGKGKEIKKDNSDSGKKTGHEKQGSKAEEGSSQKSKSREKSEGSDPSG